MRIEVHKKLRKLRESFAYALHGIYICLRFGRNFRIHIVTTFYVTIFGLAARLPVADLAVLWVCCGMVLGAEAANTAIEYLCDRSAENYDPQVRASKDAAAGYVLLCALFAAAAGLIIFLSDSRPLIIINTLFSHLLLLSALILSVPAALTFIIFPARKR